MSRLYIVQILNYLIDLKSEKILINMIGGVFINIILHSKVSY